MFRQTLFHRYPRSILTIALVVFLGLLYSLISLSSQYFA